MASENKYQPIGVFDSGYGGLSVLKDFLHFLPEYDYIYLGDNARSPYGTRSFEAVYTYTLESVKVLFNMGCNLVILACNTASAKALRTIQQNDLPKIDALRRVLGVIRPSVEALDKYTITRNVGILGTTGTVVSQSYPIEIKKLYPDIVTVQEACPMWVPLVENNEYECEGADYFVKKHVENLLVKNNNIDTIILGCTHYPLMIDKIKQFVPPEIQLISQGEIVAKSLHDYLQRHPEMEAKCSKNGTRKFFTSDSVEMFENQGRKFLGTSEKLNVEHIAMQF